MSEPVIVYATFGSMEEAKKVAEDVVGRKLAACANIIPNVTSVYRWEGQINTDQEVVVIFKTVKDFARLLAEEVKRLNTYEVPAIVGLPIIGGDPDYLDWVTKETIG